MIPLVEMLKERSCLAVDLDQNPKVRANGSSKRKLVHKRGVEW